jgi:hypothetical protein
MLGDYDRSEAMQYRIHQENYTTMRCKIQGKLNNIKQKSQKYVLFVIVHSINGGHFT